MATSVRNEIIELHPDVKINALLSKLSPPDNDSYRPAILFLHFWGGSVRTWSYVNAIVGSHLATIALDFRGWGGSTGPDVANAYTIQALAGDVQAVIAELKRRGHIGAGGVILVGLSMGAKVAQLVASRIYDLVSGIVLVSPAPAIPLHLPRDMQEQQLHAYDNTESATFVAKNVLTESFRADKDLPGFVVEDMLRGNRWARAAWPAYAMAEDVAAAVTARPAKPTLVLAADRDVVEPLDRVKSEVLERIPGAQLVILSGSGHLSPLDAPEAVADRILRFAGELPKLVPE